MAKIAYLGIPGSFSYSAAKRYFTSKDKYVGAESFKKIFSLLKEKKVDFGVVPIENTLAGSIYENYDLLDAHKCFIVGEYNLKIEHDLLVSNNFNKNIRAIKKVYSHQKALEQCEKLFKRFPWLNKNPYPDTASAAKLISETSNVGVAAIASSEAGKLYNLKTIRKNIEDNKKNYTRFLVVSKKQIRDEKADKCSLIIRLPHTPGSLYKTLGVLVENESNLTKIESRPVHGRPFEYIFYLDFVFNNQNIEKIISELKKHKSKIKVLGVYKNY